MGQVDADGRVGRHFTQRVPLQSLPVCVAVELDVTRREVKRQLELGHPGREGVVVPAPEGRKAIPCHIVLITIWELSVHVEFLLFPVLMEEYFTIRVFNENSIKGIHAQTLLLKAWNHSHIMCTKKNMRTKFRWLELQTATNTNSDN